MITLHNGFFRENRVKITHDKKQRINTLKSDLRICLILVQLYVLVIFKMKVTFNYI